MWAKTAETAMNLGKEKGVQYIELAPGERQQWIEATKQIELDWVKEMEAKGFPARELYEMVYQMVKELQGK